MSRKTMKLFGDNQRTISRAKEPSLWNLNEALVSLAQDVEDLQEAVRQIALHLDHRAPR